MCRLYADKGKKESGIVDLLVGFRFKREDAEILEREVREHREWQRKHGYDVLGGGSMRGWSRSLDFLR